MKTKLILTSVAACWCIASQAQEVKQQTAEPKGQAIIQVFTNFHTGFGVDNHDRGFELERSYVGYQYKIGKGLTVKGVLDIGKSSNVDDYQRIAYIKNALVTWKTGNLKLSGGLISTTQFNYQEKFWGYRYIMKSFQDENKFGSSADAGISAAYQITDWLSADAIIVNGEGYKKIQVKDGLNYGIGLTVTPVKGLSARFYGGVNEASQDGQKDTWNGAAFLGYKNDYLSVGAEYNYMKNAGFKDAVNKSGCSFYATGKLSKKVEVFARYDNLFSDATDGKIAFLAGVQMKLGKYVKLAPNFRLTNPKADGASTRYYGYVSCYFGL